MFFSMGLFSDVSVIFPVFGVGYVPYCAYAESIKFKPKMPSNEKITQQASAFVLFNANQWLASNIK